MLFFRTVGGRVQKSGGRVPFVHNKIIGAKIAGKQKLISLLLSGDRLAWGCLP